MAEVREPDIASLVDEVIKRLGTASGGAVPRVGPSSTGAGAPPGPVYPTLNEAVAAAKAAQPVFQDLGLEKRRDIIQAMRDAGVRHAVALAKFAREESGLGRWEHKVKKNILVSLKTPGPEDLEALVWTGDHGMTLVDRAPFGVVGAVTPTTNPTSTIINNAISILSAGNAVVFAPHPSARRCCQETMRLLMDAIMPLGAPRGLIACAETASIENANALFSHPDVNMILVTGGHAVAKAAMQKSGKKVIAAGPGNPPVVVDEHADLEVAARGIVDGASFDNCVLCTGEKEVFVVASVADALFALIRKDPRTHELTKLQMDSLGKKMFLKDEKSGELMMNRNLVGRNANVIAREIGLDLPDSVALLWGEVPQDHVTIWEEQLMPVLPFARVKDVETAIDLAIKAEGDNHHTAVMYSLNVANLTKMARKGQFSIFVKNGPSYMGLGMGEGYATMSIGTPTGDGLTSARQFTRPVRCALIDHFRIV